MISTTFMQKSTVEDIIADSVKETKLENQRKRRDWVRKLLDYYGRNHTNQYIED